MITENIRPKFESEISAEDYRVITEARTMLMMFDVKVTVSYNQSPYAKKNPGGKFKAVNEIGEVLLFQDAEALMEHIHDLTDRSR
jgi:hypothetical protein